MDPELTRKVEAVLFVSGRFMDVSHIAIVLEANEKHVQRALEALRQSYADQGSALHFIEDSGAWKLHVRDEYLAVVSKIISDTEVSGPVLETLAIIAWRSPVLQAEVVEIRGSSAYEHIKELVERGFVVKEPKGRSYDLRITEKFFDYFDVEGRNDIRKVFKEVEEAHRQKEMELDLHQKRLERAIRAAENGESGVVDGDENPADEPSDAGTKTSGEDLAEDSSKLQKRANIDDLDAVLEKSAKTRERIASEMQSMRAASEEESGEDESDGEPLDELEKQRQESERVRKKVEQDADEIND